MTRALHRAASARIGAAPARRRGEEILARGAPRTVRPRSWRGSRAGELVDALARLLVGRRVEAAREDRTLRDPTVVAIVDELGRCFLELRRTDPDQAIVRGGVSFFGWCFIVVVVCVVLVVVVV